MKKFLLGFLIFIVVLLASAVAVPYFFKDKIIAKAKEQIGNYINAKTDFESIDLSLLKNIRNFPNIALGIDNLVIIGNAPFGDWGVVDLHAPPMLRHKYLQAKVHDYFVCKSVSLLHPGGVVAMITHNSTLDREEVGVREWLNEHAELVAAYRLPANLWEGQGAAPVSDVLVLRRR